MLISHLLYRSLGYLSVAKSYTGLRLVSFQCVVRKHEWDQVSWWTVMEVS